MMKLGLITNIQYLKTYASLFDFHLILAHLCLKSKVYMNFYSKLIRNKGIKNYFMLDNSTFELGYALRGEDLVFLSNKLKVDEVVVPEVPNDAYGTHLLVKEFISKHKKHLHKYCKIAAVIHGSTWQSRINLFLEYCKIPEIDTICIPAVTDSIEGVPIYQSPDFTTRQVINRQLFIDFITTYYSKPIHLLGLCDPLELLFYKNNNIVRSNDSSMPFIYGVRNKHFNNIQNPKPTKNKNWFWKEYNNKRIHKNVLYNINKWKEYANGRL